MIPLEFCETPILGMKVRYMGVNKPGITTGEEGICTHCRMSDSVKRGKSYDIIIKKENKYDFGWEDIKSFDVIDTKKVDLFAEKVKTLQRWYDMINKKIPEFKDLGYNQKETIVQQQNTKLKTVIVETIPNNPMIGRKIEFTKPTTESFINGKFATIKNINSLKGILNVYVEFNNGVLVWTPFNNVKLLPKEN
jgi:hypothetical protein